MKTRFFAALVSTLFLLLSGSFNPAFAGEQLQIYHLGIGQGDATVIIMTFKSGYEFRVLIDTGNSKGKGTAVFAYLKELFEDDGEYLNLVITSHLHSDHLGGTPEVLELLGKNDWKVGYIIDRAGGISPDPGEFCYDTGGEDVDNDPVAPEFSEPTSNIYKSYVKKADTYYADKRITLQPGTEVVAPFFKNYAGPFYLYCIVGNAQVLKKYGSNDVDQYKPKDENDLSYAWVLQYNGFRYFTGGDIGGGGGGYTDLETPMCNYFATWPNAKDFHFCAQKVSHHGSAHSSKTNWIAAGCANPTVSIISSALRSFKGTQIPTRETLERLNSVNSKLFYTFIKTSGNYYSGTVNYYNNVFFTVTTPGYGNNIAIELKQETVNKTTLEVIRHWGDSVVACTKNHPAPNNNELLAVGATPPVDASAVPKRVAKLSDKVGADLYTETDYTRLDRRRYSKLIDQQAASMLPASYIAPDTLKFNLEGHPDEH